MVDESKTTGNPSEAKPIIPQRPAGNPLTGGFQPSTPNAGTPNNASGSPQFGTQYAGNPNLGTNATGNFGATGQKPASSPFTPKSSFNSGAQQQPSQAAPSHEQAGNADLIMSIPVEVQVVLGGTTMPVATLMNLGRGAVITLDKQIGDPVDIVVNGRVIARGEVIVMEDDSSRFGVSLTEIIGK